MYLLIDGQPLQAPETRNRGIGRYSRHLVAALARQRPDWRIEFVQATHFEPLTRDGLESIPTRWLRPPLPTTPTNAAANERYYADWLSARGADAVFVPSFSFYQPKVVVPRFTPPRPPLFGVMYDLIPLLFPHFYLAPEHYPGYGHRLRQLLQCDGLLTISECSAADFRDLFPPPRPEIVNIGGATDPAFAPHTGDDLDRYRRWVHDKFDLEDDYILYVGGFDPRKNLTGAMETFAALPSSRRRALKLVIACDVEPNVRRYLTEIGQRLGIAERLVLTGYVTDEELRALYQFCRLFFFPSLYEGLGLPVLEALHCGAPVLASDRASVPEYAAPVCRLFDPTDPARAALTLTAELDEPRDRDLDCRLAHARGFTWERPAARAAELFEARRRAEARRRVAWLSPLPPRAGETAGRCRRLLGALAGRFEVDVFLGPDQLTVTPDVARGHLVQPAGRLPTLHDGRPYDVCVYHVGGPCPEWLVALATRVPGLVVWHGPVGEESDEIRRRLADSAFRVATGRELSREADFVEAVEAALADRRSADRTWSEAAAGALAACEGGPAADALVGPWSALRERACRAACRSA
jgi:glycosyltransferase involved in cell wall biosynthesis